jgi:hypothetical protein
MIEPLRVNLTPLNQLAKKHLVRLKHPFSREEVYALQLAQWALDNRLVATTWRADRLPAWLNMLLYQEDQEWVGRFLENDHNVLRGIEPKVSSQELAWEILEQLHDRLVATQEYYP